MNQQTIEHAQEFDKSVSEYNEWLASLENPKVQKKNNWRAFFRGMGSILDIFGNSFSTQTFAYGHLLYSRADLSPEQKDAIALASDWQRVDRSLDKILLSESSNDDISVEDAKAGKPLVQQMYGHFRNVYVSRAMR